MTAIEDTWAAARLRSQMMSEDMSVREVLKQQDLGVTLDDVVDYVSTASVLLRPAARDEDVFLARLAGVVAAAMCLGAELERDRARWRKIWLSAGISKSSTVLALVVDVLTVLARSASRKGILSGLVVQRWRRSA
jgi:hypothetical protein